MSILLSSSGIDLFFEKMSIFENKTPVISPIIQNLLNDTNKIDLTLIKQKIKEELQWSEQRINNSISEYYKILIMIKLKVNVITTNDIDEIWKRHFITKQYIDDCYYFFGHFVDYKDMTIHNEEIQNNMINTYKKFFCQDFSI
jgi:hypothetical protein